MEEPDNIICKGVQRGVWHAQGTKLCSGCPKHRVQEIGLRCEDGELGRGQIMEYLKSYVQEIEF